MIFKYFLLLLFCFTGLHAQKVSLDYRVEFGIMGTVAKVHTDYYNDGKNYTLDTHLSTVGIVAKKITDDLKENHICKGYIDKKGLLIATSYEMRKSYGAYSSTTRYTINHQHKSIQKTFKKWKTRLGKTKGLDYQYSDKLHYYAKDDLITFFVNLNQYIADKHRAKKYQFKVTGADKKNGRVDIEIPAKKKRDAMENLLGKMKTGEWIMNVIMHRELYNSKKGELMVRMGKRGYIQKAVLKDILFYGDVRIIRE